MVALKHGLPLIQNERGVAVSFENDWLKAAVDKAARKAGYDTWWLLDEFSDSISLYLRHTYQQNLIHLKDLDRVVRSTLRDIGYGDIAARFRTVNPFQTMSLAACLGTTASKREPAFFKKLAEHIAALHAARVRHFHFYDLHVCVQRLLEDRETGKPLLRSRIVSFVRERMLALAWQRGVQCTIR